MKKQGFTTRALNVSFAKKDPHNSLQMPLYESVAFEFDSAEQIAANFRGEYIAHVYSRSSSPTVEYFELKLKALTESYGVIAVSSGMAAISNTLMAIVKSGENIISGNHLFGHSYSLLKHTLPEFGIQTRFSNLKIKEEIELLIDQNTRAIFFETVTNPQLEISDISMLSEICKKHQILLIADSTLTPPNIFNAGEFGVNLEVVSTTKYISGGATSFGGAIIDFGNYEWVLNSNFDKYTEKFGKSAFIAKLRKNIYRNTGTSMSPQTARFQIQGLDLLELRVDRCFRNCLEIGNFLITVAEVILVNYPGLISSAFHLSAKRYFSGIPGTILTFNLKSQKACFEFMNKLQIIKRATNLNDNRSLIIHPYSTIYAEFSEEERKEMGIHDTMMRLSVGIEDADDLIEDIKQALG